MLICPFALATTCNGTGEYSQGVAATGYHTLKRVDRIVLRQIESILLIIADNSDSGLCLSQGYAVVTGPSKECSAGKCALPSQH